MLVGAVVVLGGCSESECVFPSAPSGASAITYACSGASGDGSSAQSPTGTIAEALAAAPDGGVILLARGSFAENVTITRPVSLVGSGDPGSAEAAGAEIRAPGKHAVTVKGAAGVTLQGLRIASPVEVGVWVQAAEATVTGSRVEGSTGIGILASGSARLTLEKSVVSGSTNVGVMLAGGATAIVDDNNITGNAGGGLRIDDLVKPEDGARISHNTITGNGSFGLAFFSAVAIVDDNNISGTVVGGGIGYGVIATSYDGEPASNVTLRGNTIDDNYRVGILLGGDAVAIVDDNNISGNGGSEKDPLDAGALGAGIWLQGGAGGMEGVQITRNTVTANRFAGIAVVGGARAIVDDNNISATPESKPKATSSTTDTMGDGISVAGGASADIANNVVSDCFRAGVFLSDAAGTLTTVTSNTITGNGFAMILQGKASALAPDAAADNAMSDNANGDAIATVEAGTYGALDAAIAVPEAAELPQ